MWGSSASKRRGRNTARAFRRAGLRELPCQICGAVLTFSNHSALLIDRHRQIWRCSALLIAGWASSTAKPEELYMRASCHYDSLSPQLYHNQPAAQYRSLNTSETSRTNTKMRTSATIAVLAAAAASAATIRVDVGKSGLTFSPSTITAAKGDILDFHFFPINHSVVAGDFNSPCRPATTGGFFSGFVPVKSGSGEGVSRHAYSL